MTVFNPDKCRISREYFLDIYCDNCGSIFQTNSYQSVIDIVREHLHQALNTCKVENMKISLRTSDKSDPTSDDDDDNYDQIEYENNKLIHEHDLVPAEFNGINYFLRCITCGTYFCQLCGKAVGLHNSHNGIRDQEPEEEKRKDPSIYSRSLFTKEVNNCRQKQHLLI
jgi:hypothetical protein